MYTAFFSVSISLLGTLKKEMYTKFLWGNIKIHLQKIAGIRTLVLVCRGWRPWNIHLPTAKSSGYLCGVGTIVHTFSHLKLKYLLLTYPVDIIICCLMHTGSSLVKQKLHNSKLVVPKHLWTYYYLFCRFFNWWKSAAKDAFTSYSEAL